MTRKVKKAEVRKARTAAPSAEAAVTADFRLGAASGAGLVLFVLMLFGHEWAGVGFVVLAALFNDPPAGPACAKREAA